MRYHNKKLSKVVSIGDAKINNHLGELVRGTVEETLNTLLDAEVDVLCGAQRSERSPDQVDTRAGSFERHFLIKAGEVTLKIPKLRWHLKLAKAADMVERRIAETLTYYRYPDTHC